LAYGGARFPCTVHGPIRSRKMEGKDAGPTVLSSSDLITMTVIIGSFLIAISFSVLILSRSDSLIGGIPITATLL
jgi:hypothetical protein